MSEMQSSDFTVAGGSLYGHLFENRQAGVPRDVYWACSVEFVPIVHDESEWPASLTFEWITWPVRRWQDLDGCTLSHSSHEGAPEVSLYLFGMHQPVDSFELSLRQVARERFAMRAEVELDLDMLDGSVIPSVRLVVEAEVPLEGLIVVPGNLFPKPTSAAEVLQALSPFAEPSGYGAPTFDRFRWILRPT